MNPAAETMQTVPAGVDYIRFLPEIVLSIFGMLVMVLDPLVDEERSQKLLGLVALLGTLTALAATLFMSQYPGLAFWNMIQVDSFSVFFHFLVIAVAALVILSSYEYMTVQRIRAGEYYGLILFGAVGMALMSSAVELVLIFIALEISSISTYILAGFRRREAISSESSIKYFLLGSFATAFFLYGIALMFGATGSTSIWQISQVLHSKVPLLAYVATALMFVGLGFKVASAPFHVWTPDVYEGAPAPIVGLMSTGPKAAVFAVLLRIFFQANAPGRFWLIWVSAALSMTLGNVAALVQTNIKRLLAYSSIAHAGYRRVELEDYAGLGRRSPLLAATLTIFLLSLIGIPMTGGFFAKFYVFSAALKANLVVLTIIGVINSAIGAYYYLRVIVLMYMREPREETALPRVPIGVGITLAITAITTIYLGLFPGRVVNYSLRSAHQLVRQEMNATDITPSLIH